LIPWLCFYSLLFRRLFCLCLGFIIIGPLSCPCSFLWHRTKPRVPAVCDNQPKKWQCHPDHRPQMYCDDDS
jgi:hypothetical protein